MKTHRADSEYSGTPGIYWTANSTGTIPGVSARIYGAIQGMVSTFGDPHTVFLDPKTAAIVKSDDQGSFEGIGAAIQLDEETGLPTIGHVYEGTPAAAAGLRQGDAVLKVDEVSTEGMTVLEVITRIRGPKNSTTHLLIARGDDHAPFDVPVVRQSIEIPVTESRMLDDGIAYLKLSDFNNTAADRVKTDLESLLAHNAHSLVFDLRGNPGGYLQIAVEIGSQFVGKGPVLTEKAKDGTEQAFDVQPGGLATDKAALPLVVLVDGGTASAAEIVAAAIHETGRGILIGEQTYGKTSVQVPHEMSDGSELRITVARWFTPNGNEIKDGLTPDIQVAAEPLDAAQSSGDRQLDRAVQYLLTGK